MNIDQGKPAPAETVIEDDEIQTSEPLPPPENPLARFDGDTLRAIGVSDVGGPGIIAFLPRSMAEAMEFAKLMAASNSVPPHLRGNRGDCLAIVIQATRWGADPFAVANKTYFVNNRMAYEAQLVAAVVNTSRILDGRLQVSWQGSVGKAGFQCTVRGRIKGDSDVHELIQEIDTITTRNSPLWKQSQRIQLGYYTMRGWARLYAPEVLLGIYTVDEVESIAVTPGTQTVIAPPKPTRDSVRADAAAAERVAKEVMDTDARNAGRMPDSEDERGEDAPAHDPETGQVNEDAPDAADGPSAQQVEFAKMLIAKVKGSGSLKVMKQVINEFAEDLNELDATAHDLYAEVQAEIKARTAWFAR